MKPLPTHGMLLGKFLPPHVGHVFLGEFAQNYVEHLTIIVGSLEREPIPGKLRFEWMKKLFPNSNVVHLDKELPQEPSEHPDFWNIWRTELQQILPSPPEFIFASEEYGHKLAKELGAKFIPVDIDRENRKISGTKLRESPFKYWDFIPNVVRPYFLKKVCIFGPESTGKSTLTQNLAEHFNTIGVTEYARTYLETMATNLEKEQLIDIARGQVVSQKSLESYANKVIFTDTDALTTKVWSEFLYNSCDPIIEDLVLEQDYDLYILSDVDVPWVEDDIRYLPNDRKNFYEACERTLLERGKNVIKVSGHWDERFSIAKSAVENLIGGASNS